MSVKATTPTAVTRYSTIYNNEAFQLEWKNIFALPFKTTYTLNRILFTISLLFKIGKVNSPLCYFWKKKMKHQSTSFSPVKSNSGVKYFQP